MVTCPGRDSLITVINKNHLFGQIILINEEDTFHSSNKNDAAIGEHSFKIDERERNWEQ